MAKNTVNISYGMDFKTGRTGIWGITVGMTSGDAIADIAKKMEEDARKIWDELETAGKTLSVKVAKNDDDDDEKETETDKDDSEKGKDEKKDAEDSDEDKDDKDKKTEGKKEEVKDEDEDEDEKTEVKKKEETEEKVEEKKEEKVPEKEEDKDYDEMEVDELKALCKKRGIEKSPKGLPIDECNKGKMIAALELYDEKQED